MDPGDPGSSGAGEEMFENVSFSLPLQDLLFTREDKAGLKVEAT
jgi:hypothetical protein